MYTKSLSTIVTVTFLLIVSCSRKQLPQQNNKTANIEKDTVAIVITPKPLPTKTVIKKIRTPRPKVIVVNDEVAKKSVDGRLYYDLEGQRYWKNYNDGKYYIFNKTMYTDKAYKPH